MLAGVTFQPSDAFQQVRVPQPSHAQPRSSSWRNRFAASPVSHGLRHLASVSKSPPLRLIFSHSREKAGTTKSSCTAFQTCSSSAPPFSRDTPAGRTVGDVHGPDLVGPRDGKPAQQIGINPVSWRGFGGVGPTIDGLDTHPPHQGCNVTATY